MRAGGGGAAGGTLEICREAAPVEEHERLTPALEVRGERGGELLGHEVGRPAAQRHYLDRRQRMRRRPLGQLEQREAAVVRGVVGLGRRRGGCEHHHGARQPGAHDADVAGIVAEPVLLLVRGVVLLVDDDEAEPRKRSEDRRACADDHRRIAVADASPLVPALAGPETAVQDGHGIAEAGAHAIDQLMRERDLGHEEQDAPPRGQRPFGGGEEDLGLAAPGDPVQEEGRGLTGCDRRGDRVECGALGRRERQPRRGIARRRRRARARTEGRFRDAGRDERPQGGRAHAGRPCRRDPELPARRLAQHPVGAAACGRAPRERRFLVRGEPAHQTHDAFVGRRGQGHGYDGREHVGERGQVVACRPAAELQELGRYEWIRIEHFEDGTELARRCGVGEARHDAGARLPAERHAHPHARLDARAQQLGHAIREEIVQRHGRERCNLDEPVHQWPAC